MAQIYPIWGCVAEEKLPYQGMKNTFPISLRWPCLAISIDVKTSTVAHILANAPCCNPSVDEKLCEARETADRIGASLPFDRGRWLLGNVISHPVHTWHFIYDTA
jgi:hypothetical protein